MIRLSLNLGEKEILHYSFEPASGKHELALTDKLGAVQLNGNPVSIGQPAIVLDPRSGECLFMAAVSLTGVRFYRTSRVDEVVVSG